MKQKKTAPDPSLTEEDELLLPKVFWNKVEVKFLFFLSALSLNAEKIEAGNQGNEVNAQNLKNLNKT